MRNRDIRYGKKVYGIRQGIKIEEGVKVWEDLLLGPGRSIQRTPLAFLQRMPKVIMRFPLGTDNIIEVFLFFSEFRSTGVAFFFAIAFMLG